MSAGGALDRREVVAESLRDRGELMVVSDLGFPFDKLMAAGDHNLNQYLRVAMGSAAMVGLGLAAARPERPVLVLTGDGKMLMGLGALATIALRKPPNLSVVILDNGHFGETAMQPSHAGQGIGFTRLAAAMDYRQAETATEQPELAQLRQYIHARTGLTLATVKIAANAPRVLLPRDEVEVKNRFRRALGFPTN